MARVDFLLSTDRRTRCSSTRSTRFPGSRPISMYPKMWEASGLPYPALIDRLHQLALERHAEKQQLRHQHHVRARGSEGATVRWCTRAVALLLLAVPGIASPQTTRPDGRSSAWRASTTRSSMRGSIRSRPPHARRAARTQAVRRPKPVSCSRWSSLWWQIQLDPKNRVHDDAVPHQVGRGHRGHRGVDRARAERAERPGSTSAARTGRARSGGCCEKNGWPRRATANASRTRSNRRSRSTRRCTMPTSASACITTTPTSRPPRSAMLRWLLLLPGGDRLQGMREMLRARSERTAPAERGRLPAAPDLSVVREAAAARAAAPARLAGPPSAEIRCSCSSSPRSRTSTCTICRPARHTWQALLESAQARRVAQPAMTEATARLGLAGVLDRLSESDTAMQHLRAIIEMKPAGPYGVARARATQAGTGARSSRPPRRRAPRVSRCTRRGAARRSRWNRPRSASWTSRTMSVTWTKYDERVREASSSLRRKSIDDPSSDDRSITRRSSLVDRAVAIDRSCRHLTTWVRLDVSSGIAATRSFDKQRDFVLDTKEISPIIYIWYEGGWLSPPVVTATRSVGG